LDIDADNRTNNALQGLDDFKEYSRQHLPRVVESSLEAILHEKLELVRDELKSALGDVVRSSLSSVYEDWQRKRRCHSKLSTNINYMNSVQQDTPDTFPVQPYFDLDIDDLLGLPPIIPDESGPLDTQGTTDSYLPPLQEQPSNIDYTTQLDDLQLPSFTNPEDFSVNAFHHT